MPKEGVPLRQRAAYQARVRYSLLFSWSVVVAVPYPPSLVQAASPITSSGLNTQVTLSPTPPAGKTQYDITGGTRPGGGPNLFHSFGNFNVPNNNIANFLNSGSIDPAEPNAILPSGLPTSDILGRINGGNPSSIFGMIQTNGPGGFPTANLFLMNPNGFLFGPNATISVGGMVTFTTADYPRHTDNTQFNAVAGPADALLTAAPIAAFGFLGNNPASIAITGSQLTAAEGTGISLVGGNITIQSGTLSAPSGQTNLVSVGPPLNPTVGAEVVLSGSGQSATLTPTGFGSLGQIGLTNNSTLRTSGNPSGTVFIRGGQLTMVDALIVSNTLGSVNGPATSVDIGIDGTVAISGNFGLFSTTEGSGNAGAISLQVGKLTLTGGAINASSIAPGTGNGGNVTVTATDSVTISGSGIITQTNGSGNAGSIDVQAPRVLLTGGGTISASAPTPTTGNGGNVTVTATDSVTISGQTTSGFSSGITTSASGSGMPGPSLSLRLL